MVKSITKSKQKAKKTSGAQPGNKNGVKLKDSQVRQQAFEQYCAWIAKGKSSRGFTFEHEVYSCDGKTLESYIKNNPLEFPSIKKDIAFSKGFAQWEEVVDQSAKGENKAPTAGLQMVMRNKYGWDKEDKKSEFEVIQQIAKRIGAELGFKEPENDSIQPQAD